MKVKALLHNKPAALSMLTLFAISSFIAASLAAIPEKPADLLTAADKQFKEKNYKEAYQTYAKLLQAAPKHEKWTYAAERIIQSKLRLQLFGEALESAEDYVKRAKGTYVEARAERLTGNLWMLIPHWGTRSGGEFHRGQWKQGIYLRSHRHDKKTAIEHLEKARSLYTHYDNMAEADKDPLPDDVRKLWHNERIECSFDLASAVSRFGIYENSWTYWYAYWGERDDFTAETAGEEDFDEYNTDWQLRRKRPIGLRLDKAGNPIFTKKPGKYNKNLNDDQKILYLLGEARDLDDTKTKKYTGLSYYRQAMLSRSRFGMDRLNGYANMYYVSSKRPLLDELAAINPWELKDNQAIVLAGGKVRQTKLPTEWDVIALLRTAFEDYAKSGIAGESHYSLGLYHQSRQQYLTALKEYDNVVQRHGGTQWANNSNTQAARIKLPQVKISNSSVQLPGSPIELQVSHRNTSKVYFVAREIDHEGYMRELRAHKGAPRYGMRGFYALSNWHNYFVNGYNTRNWAQTIAAKYIGKEVIRWSDEVKNDGSRKYSHDVLQAPLKKTGAYMVYAYLKDPPKNHAELTGTATMNIGDSRAIFGLTDISIVEKPVKEGNLYMISAAQDGAPIANAAIEVLEVWSTYDRKLRKSIYHRQMHNLKTDKDGLAVLNRSGNRNSQLHALVKSGAKGDNRLAWTGMRYWSRYNPSRTRSGKFAYCITDRPVYRPSQTVRYKVWLRQMNQGLLENRADRQLKITIYDPRGAKVKEETLHTDQFGGTDATLTLGEEPRLGVYRLQIQDLSDNRHASYLGGQTFRVEEYKKPEFEVSVEAGKDHAKLGEKVQAKIKATYFFGGPVTNATVSYKVFREQYTHSWHGGGRWDWLYGRGYGYAYYGQSWLPWWDSCRLSCVAPSWYGGMYGRPQGNPVRELVMQGSQQISQDGTLTLDLDTKNALRDHPDYDHRYVVQAEVRDSSRRIITGEGAVKVTRQAYYSFVRPSKGYYRPGEEMFINIKCMTPDNKPIETEGVVTVSEVVFGGPNNAHLKETQLKSWKVKTNELGELKIQLRNEKSAQLKVKFTSPDKWGGTVEGVTMIWVAGRDFTGKLYRFNDLELITDKRTYKPGEVAHIMVNTKHSNSHVLFASEVDNNHLISYRMLKIPGRSTVIDVPITKNHTPNFFVEATTVNATRVHTQTRRMLVPPDKNVIDLTIDTDKPEYKPGEKAKVTVTAKDLDGNPVEAQFVLSGFDKSVLYISPETTPNIAKFFHGNVRRHYTQYQTNLIEQFGASGYVHRPFQQLYPYPGAWWGIWGPTVSDWRTVDDKDFGDLAGRDGLELQESADDEAGGIGGLRQAAGEQSRKRSNASKPGSVANNALASSDAAAAPRSAMAKSKNGAFGADKKTESANGPAGGQAGQGGGDLVDAAVRSNFADTALWVTTLTTDPKTGKATASFTMPDNLTTWKLNAWASTKNTRVGQADTSAITTKNLLVRLQAPRFFMEYDEVVVSAVVNNYLSSAKQATVSLDIPSEHLQFIGKTPQKLTVTVPANGEHRVDWRVKVLKEGTAKVLVKSLTNEESDAMAMTFPVLVHGMSKQIATTGSMRPDDKNKTVNIALNIPKERRPELSRLEVQYAPSLVGSMLDALPYLLYYPYDTSEANASRFMPAVLTLKTIQNMGVSLEEIRNMRGKMDEIRRIEKGERREIYGDNAVFHSAELKRVIDRGLGKLTKMQNNDGGWGWWRGGRSSGYFTSYVLWSLVTAQQSDIPIDQNMINRGMNYLRNWEISEMRKTYWSVQPQHAFAAYVLSLKNIKASYKPNGNDKRDGDLINRLYTGRDKLSLYGKALLCLATANLKDMNPSKIVLTNIKQYLETNDETQIAWFRTPNTGWWYWWNNDIETNAWILKCLTKHEPKSDISPRVVKWLLNNRKNGYYWRSTRDTTMVLSAMSDFVVASGEGDADYELTFDFDNGKVVKKVKINQKNFFTFDNKFTLDGVALGTGKHNLKITKKGKGALYFNSYLSYFTKEKDIKSAGHELKVERTYFKLEQFKHTVKVEGSEGQSLKENRLRYKRIPLKNGDAVKSGDIIQVELKVKADNNYTYLALEDPKPAGCEPMKVTSGNKTQEGFYSYMEMRDEKVAIFMKNIDQGDHLVRYRLRAEIPGVFHALPTRFYAMYVPELKANSNEHVMKIID